MTEETEEEKEKVDVYIDSDGNAFPSAWTGSEFPNYAALAGQVPFDKDRHEYSEVERRAEIYKLIEQAGHPKKMEQSQVELGERFGVSQQQISKDMKRLRDYVAEHDPTRAKSVVGWLVEETVTLHVDAAQRLEKKGELEKAAERMERAKNTQLDFVRYLMEAGDMDSASRQIEIEGNASDLYMEMLRQASE